MYKRILAALLLLIWLFAYPIQTAAQKTLNVGAKSVVVMDAVSGRILYAQNPYEVLPMASTTKIMTALLTLEEPYLDAYFEVDSQAIKTEGSSMGLKEGDMVSLRALAVGMLLASGNDAANAAAVKVAGSIDAFVMRMNARAKLIGMENTVFETPSGLDEGEHASTAYDMALLAREALQNEEFLKICSSESMSISYGNPPYKRTLTNHNKLLTMYENAIGVKTGYTKKAGRCLVSAAEKDGMRLIIVTFNCPDDWNVHESLYNQAFEELSLVSPQVDEMENLSIKVTGGEDSFVKVHLANTPQFPVFEGEESIFSTKVYMEPFLYAPVKKGDICGKVCYYWNDEWIATADLTAADDVLQKQIVKKRSFFEQIWDFITGLFT